MQPRSGTAFDSATIPCNFYSRFEPATVIWRFRMIVLITGATAGFGAEMASKFVKNGHQVIASGRRQDRLDALAAELGPLLSPLIMDVTSKDSVAAALASLSPALQNIDVLINNAGLALGVAGAQSASLEDWETMIETNCKGLVTVTRHVLPGMVERNTG